MKNYKHYTATDFATDADFLEWVKHPSEESELFWTRFINENPHKRAEIDTARALLRSMVFKRHLLLSEKEAMWRQIRIAVQKQKEGRLFS
jgi:hypothetical protein